MSNEFDDDDLDLESSSFDEFEEKGGSTLGDLWRENSLVKVGVVGVAAVAIFLGISMFGEDEAPVAGSVVAQGSKVKAPPGTEEATPAYVEAVQEKTQERIEEAQKTGTSALPTPIEPSSNRLEVPDQQEEQEDPLQRWRQIQEERLQRELQQTQIVEGPVIDESQDQTEAIQAVAEVMSSQMQAILEAQTVEVPIQSRTITPPDFLQALNQQAEEEAAAAAAAEAQSNLTGESIIIMPAGEILYGQLITEANSDIPGPVLAQIASGPLKGSKVLGSFQTQNELITLNFNTLVYKGESLSIEAVAVDPNTTLPGMATEVDRRIFKRVVLPAAAAFVEGLSSAIAESGRTSVTVSGETVIEDEEETTNEQEVASGIEEAGRELGDILDDIADDTEVLVRIAAGTPMGILFVGPVIKPADGNSN